MQRCRRLLLSLILAPSLACAQPVANYDDVLEFLCPPFEPVTDETERFTRFGYSVLPPSSGYWCSFTPTPRLLTFHALKLDADATRRPTREFMAHTFLVMGGTYTIQEADLERFPTLEEFVQAWTEQTRGSFTPTRDEMYVDFNPTRGFTYVSSSVSVDASMGADCVRYESEFEERGNENVPRSWVLSFRTTGVTCRHPDASNLLVDIVFSERMRKGAPNPDPGAWEALLLGVQATFNSLRLESLDPPPTR
jgi:hypothetical protein